jgi:hypothetical protein
MINQDHILQFCNTVRVQYGAGFTQQPTHNGFKVVGEYCTFSGQVLSIMIDVTRAKVEIKVYDAARRLIFSDSTTGNINNSPKVITFFQKSMTKY